MLRTILVNEIDRVLAECRAISFALREGCGEIEVLERERVKGAWRFLVEVR